MTAINAIKKLEGTLVYVRMNEPQKSYVKPGTPPKPDGWQASVVITDKEVIKAYKKFGKEIDTLLAIKEVDASDFEATYKCPLPEGAGDEVWVVTLRKSTELGKTGKPVPDKYRPRVYEQVGNTRQDITFTKEVGNGSYGFLSIELFEKSDGSGSVYLKNCLVTDLVEYIRTDSDAAGGSEFDDGEAPAQPKDKVQSQAPAKAAAKSTKKAKVEDEFGDESLPF